MKPLSRRELVRKFRGGGFDGPVYEGRHPYVIRGNLKVRIPRQHGKDVTAGLQQEILRQAGIAKDMWDKA